MPIAAQTTMFDVYDCKVYVLESDTVGASPTYGSAIDVPGIANVSLDPNFQSAELKGDSRVLAKRGRVDKFNFQAQYGMLSFEVLDAILGGTTHTQDGTTPNQARHLAFAAPGTTAYFGLGFQIRDLDTGLGCLNVFAYKCSLTGGTLFSGQTDQFGQPSMTIEAIAIDGEVDIPDDGDVTTVENIAVLASLYESLTSLRA
jgi:hypothetical protein